MNRLTFITAGLSEDESLTYQNIIREAIDVTRPSQEHWAVSMQPVTKTSVLMLQFRRESELPRSLTFQPQEDIEAQLFRVVRQLLIFEWPDNARHPM